jgi:hypothetical protein
LPSYVPKHPGPIRVWSDDSARTFLEGALDPRLQVVDAKGAEGPDLVVIRSNKSERVAQVLPVVPRALLDRIAAGRALLVLETSAEGPHYTHHAAGMIHNGLRAAGISPARTAYVTANRSWNTIYRGFCQVNGLEPVHLLHYDTYIRDFFADHEAGGAAEFAARLAAFEARPPRRDRKFVCLNFTPRAPKILLLLQLLADGLFDQAFISFAGFDKALNARAAKRTPMLNNMLGLVGLGDIGVDLLPYVEDLRSRGPMMLGEADAASAVAAATTGPNPLALDKALDEYNRAWFTVVTESDIGEFGERRRVSEKPFKPLANFSPYVNFGTPGSLEIVRSFGFRTFGAAFDEAYDEEIEPRRRFLMLRDEIRRLCALPEDEWARLETSLADTLVFNARHALVEMPARYRHTLEPQLFDDLIDLRDGASAAA